MVLDNKRYFTTGDFAKLCQVTKHTLFYYDEIKVMPSTGYGYYEVVVATLDFSGRDDLIEEDAKMDNYFRDSDLRSLPDVRKRIMLVPRPNIQAAWEQDYKSMCSSMIFGDKPTFKELLARMAMLEKRFHEA